MLHPPVLGRTHCGIQQYKDRDAQHAPRQFRLRRHAHVIADSAGFAFACPRSYKFVVLSAQIFYAALAVQTFPHATAMAGLCLGDSCRPLPVNTHPSGNLYSVQKLSGQLVPPRCVLSAPPVCKLIPTSCTPIAARSCIQPCER